MASSSHPIPSSPSIIAPPHRDEDDDKATGSDTEETSEGAFPSAAASVDDIDDGRSAAGVVAGTSVEGAPSSSTRRHEEERTAGMLVYDYDAAYVRRRPQEGWHPPCANKMVPNLRMTPTSRTLSGREGGLTPGPIAPPPANASEQLMGFHKHQNEVQLIESCVYPDFLDCNPGLNDEITTFLDELYLSEFRKPWSPGDGICISADAPYNCNHQMSIHRKSYLRQNYGKENSTITTATDGNTFRWSYGTGSGRITHGIPKR